MKKMRTFFLTAWLIALLAVSGSPLLSASAHAFASLRQGKQPVAKTGDADDADSSRSEMRALIERFILDRAILRHRESQSDFDYVRPNHRSKRHPHDAVPRQP